MLPTITRKIKLDKETVKSPNLTGSFSPDDLTSIGNWAWDGYEEDRRSRLGWEDLNRAAMDLAMQVTQAKTFPWPDASNVQFPLITIATLQFHSRAYPAIIQGPEVVRYRVVGEDPTGTLGEAAARIGCHMSYQVMEEDQAWEEQHDRMLINIPIVGCAFKKSYYDGIKGQNVSELVLARDLVMDYYAKSVETCGRKTHVIPKSRNDIYSLVKSGAYRDCLKETWYAEPQLPQPEDGEDEARRDRTVPPATPSSLAPFQICEQHTYLDLDGDGYAEPAILTFERTSKFLLRIALRFERLEDIERNSSSEIISIRATEYFTKYGFIPSPDGSIYDMGFGVLIGSLNHAVNTNINQLIDAGTMKNLGGGFLGRGAKIRGGAYSFRPGEWKRLDSTGDDVRKNLVPLELPEPSAVLFNLLTLLIQYTDRVSGSTEAITGENPGQNTKVGTYEGMVEQGSKVYAAIFKRIWRSMKEEFKKLYVLNSMFMPDKLSFGDGYKVGREDYRMNPDRICPVADPNVVSEHTRVQQAFAIADRARAYPGYNVDAAEVHFLKSLRVEGYQQLYIGAANTPQPKPYQITVAELKAQTEQAKAQQAQLQFIVEMQEQIRVNDATILQLQAQAEKFAADAQSESGWQQVELINAMLNATKERTAALNERVKLGLEALRIQADVHIAQTEASAQVAAAKAKPNGTSH
jgi:chaperonin GroES